MPDLTIITPIAPTHLALFANAQESVKAQSIETLHLWAIDHDQRGAGYMRNRLLEQVTTPYFACLDADDWLEPDFARVMLAALEENVYTYCDWFQNGEVIHAPDCAWINRTAHLVTSVVPTAWYHELGGFDESLAAAEDTDFFVKLVTSGHYGKRVKTPLLHYRANGGRSQAAHDSGEIEAILRLIQERYRGKQVGCCGDEGKIDTTPIGEKQAHDVLAQAQWGGNRAEYGRYTGRRYPRTSWPKAVWVDPRDVSASPNLWRVVVESPPDPKAQRPRPPEALAKQLIQAGVWQPAPPPTPDVPHVIPLPNFTRARRLAGAVKLPTFVAPFRDYPSYSDLWRLVELSGFERVYAHQIDLDDLSETYIFISPDGIPDCTNAKARCIFWQFEYQGDYTNQPNKDTCPEQWSSDPTDAKTRGARFVLLGSHPYLNPTLDKTDPQYDLTLLGYMTDRRRVIKDQLSEYRWTPDYPGHDTATRHEILRSTRLMLHVHQHDTPALAPIRYALAAAYKLPVLVEFDNTNMVPELKDHYLNCVIPVHYHAIAVGLRRLLDPSDLISEVGERLYQSLCIDNPFDKGVMEALSEQLPESTPRTEKPKRKRKVKK